MSIRRTHALHIVFLPVILIALAAATLACACGDSGAPSAGSSAAGGNAAIGSPTPTATVSSYEGEGLIAFIKDQHLYTIESEGTGRTLIADDARCAAWSPDGSEIAYGSPMGLFVVKGDGSDRRRVVATEMGYGGSGIAWSPDGKRLAFNAPGGYISQLWVVNADGSGLTNLSEVMEREGGSGYPSWPAWSPQGRIFFGNPGAVVSVDPDGSDLETVTAAGDDAIPGFSLSHDGKWLLLWDSKSGGCIRMAASGSGVASVVLEESPCRDQGIASSWSPDGKRIVFSGSAWSGPTSLHIVRADGSHLREVPNTKDGHDPVWQPLPQED